MVALLHPNQTQKHPNPMIPKQTIQAILQDLRLDLADEFDRNFTRQAFFEKRWPSRRHTLRRTQGKNILSDTGSLRRSIQSVISGDQLAFSSNQPHAEIHNNGGTITITPRMRRFFWAMYYRAAGRITHRRDGSTSRSRTNTQLSDDAAFWRAMALRKVGDKIKIPQRQFIGHHPSTDTAVEQIASQHINQAIDQAITSITNKT